MSTFNIDDEIDKLVNKFSEDLKTKLKKAVNKNEKIVLKQYVSAQKSTTASSKKESKNKKNKKIFSDTDLISEDD